jgi:DNA sulfur modification protein DndB
VYKFAALRVQQRADVPLYVFGVDGRIIHQFAAVNFAERTSDGLLSGYQRGEVSAHIRQIAQYLSGPDAILPNAIVVAFDDQVSFTPSEGSTLRNWGTPGTLAIPIPATGRIKPGLIVDGQQRVSALAQLPAHRKFPVVVVGFATASEQMQLEQFILVNKTKPLPRDLINELLPQARADQLPSSWRSTKFAAGVVDKLRFDAGSPFFGRIKGVSSSGPNVNISQAALLSVTSSSMRTGVLKAIKDEDQSDGQAIDRMARVLGSYFGGVRRVWPEAWNGSPWTSRLVHGVGLFAMGQLMEVVFEDANPEGQRAASVVENRLVKMRRRCAWTHGHWPKPLDCPWDALQNTSQDKRRLGSYLEREYARLR